LTFVSQMQTAGPAFTLSNAGNVISNTIATLNAGASATFSVVATVSAGAASGSTISNTATVTTTTTDPDLTNNTSTASTTVNTSADLAVVKTAPATIVAGNNITYSITISNNGPSNAQTVVLIDNLPAGTTFVSQSQSTGPAFMLSNAGNSISNTIATLNAGASATFSVVATVSTGVITGSTLSNTATVTSPTPDPTPGNNTSTTTATVVNQADLSVTNTVDIATPNIGQNVTFTVVVTNGGPNIATNVSLADLLPAGLTLVSSVPSQGTYNGGSGGWTVGTLNVGASATLTVTATVTTTGSKTSTAQVSASDQFDPDSTPANTIAAEDDQASAVVTPKFADLSVTQTIDVPTPFVGQNVTFTVTLTNSGPDATTNVAVIDLIPAGLVFVSATPGQGTYNPATGLWSVGTLPNGSSTVLTIVATWTPAGSVTNTAQVSASDLFDPDSTPNNNVPSEDDQASVVVTGQQSADLAVLKTVDDTTPKLGQIVTFVIMLTNNGPFNATGAQVSDPLPAGLAFLAATPSQGTYSSASGIWSVGALNVGASVTLNIAASVNITSPVTNVAQVSASDQFDPNLSNNISSATVRVEIADLSLTQSIDPTIPPVENGPLTFIVMLTNGGPDTATNVRILFALPPGVTFVGVNPEQGSYDAVAGVWDVGTIPVNGALTLQIMVTINPGVTSLNTTAQVMTSDQLDPDSVPANSSGVEDDESNVTLVVAPARRPAEMQAQCLGVKFNFARPNVDKLLFTGLLQFPTGFTASGKALGLNVDGFLYNCVLDAKGKFKDATHAVSLRFRRNAWALQFRVKRSDLKTMRSAINDDIVKRRDSNVTISADINGSVYVAHPMSFYASKRNKSGILYRDR